MKMTFFATLVAFMILTLTGCGGGGNNDAPPLFSTSIDSDVRFDGDIQRDFDLGTFSVLQGSRLFLLAGIDPLFPVEYRAFLHFSLAAVPVNAIINSAFLDIVINSVEIQPPANTIPMRIDLLSFSPPSLVGSDFDLPAHLNTPPVRFPIFLTDASRLVTIDVTALMIQAQRSQLPDFQVRIMEELGNPPPGLIEINETDFPPLLTVTYF